ncbi:MAG: hypothetical protein KBT87_14350 [Gammaproteobacteria bacterium]|nr:hypothetical protein [Gammaproteobacteria bacterium]MBQ0775851.1 hypothetical protein [Gammaproteobacteria bacterium]
MKLRAILAIFLCGPINSALALEVLGGVSGRYEKSNNILQVGDGEQSEDMLVPRLDLTLVEETGRVRGSGALYLEDVDYRNDILQDQQQYGLTTAWVADVIENRLQWLFEDTASRRILDSRDTDISSNRTDQNILLTGPQLNFSANSRDELLLSARYGHSWYGEDISFDSERYVGRAELQHRLSEIATTGVHYERTRTHSLEDNVYDYDRDEAAVFISRALTRSEIRLEAGYNRVTSETGEKFSGTLADLSWRQQWRQNFYTQFRGDWRLTDAAQETISNAIDGGVDIDLIVTNDVYELKTVSFASGWNSRVWRADLYLRGEQQDYETQLLDQDIVAAEIGLQRVISQKTVLNLFFDSSRRKFLDSDRVDDDYTLNARVNRIFSNLFFGAVGARQVQRRSSVSSADFDETVVYVEFGLRGSLLARERGRELRHSGQRVN